MRVLAGTVSADPVHRAERLIEERGPGDMIEQAEVGRVHGRHPVGLVELDRDRMPRA